jgi:membrane protein DedA with SNARE-associated domain
MRLIIDLLAFLMPYGTVAYVIMFLILLACGFGLPLPEDIILITGGMLSSHGVTNHWVTLGICMAGVLIGDTIIYTAGRTMGERIKRTKLFSYLIQEERDKKIQFWFSKYGDKVIFFARFMPGLRTPLFLSSGVYRVPAWKFLLLDGIAAVISVPLWIWLGFLFGSNLELLELKIHQLKLGIYSILGVVLTLILVAWFVKKKIEEKLP